MKIQVASDLHLEFVNNFEYVMNNWKCTGEILILAGDICNFSNFDVFRSFLAKYAKNYDAIYYLPGNHEYYYSDFDLMKKNQSLIEKYSNCSLINNKQIRVGKARIIFSTLWSGAYADAPKYINDYNIIHGFSVKKENSIHKENKEFLENMLSKKSQGYTIVVTHHLPHENCVSDMFKGSSINDCFRSDQSKLMDKYRIHFWIHGHSHDFSLTEYNRTKMVRNPLGYCHIGEGKNFRPSFNIELK